MADEKRTSIYAPTYIAQLLDRVHEEYAQPGAPKYRTLETAIRTLDEQEGPVDE